jgi:hypothetical protein
MHVECVPFLKGELQEPAFHDKWFGLLFLAHLITMVLVAIMYATGGLKSRHVLQEQDEDYGFSTHDDINLWVKICSASSRLLC